MTTALSVNAGFVGAEFSIEGYPTQRFLDLCRGCQADAAQARPIDVNAGHDLTVSNLPLLVRRITYLAEVSIGHELTADALTYGMAVRRFRFPSGQSISAAFQPASALS